MTKKTNTLLDEIAERAGAAFLSDLRKIPSAHYLFTIFTGIDSKDYNMDDWKNAVSYIFDLNDASAKPNICTEIILWNTGQWGQHIAEILETHLARSHTTSCFHHVTGKYGPKLSPNKRYLVFYHPSGISREESKNFSRHKYPNIFFAAICSDYNDGLMSMDNGDCYALKLPLEKEKVIRCYEFYRTESIKKETIV